MNASVLRALLWELTTQAAEVRRFGLRFESAELLVNASRLDGLVVKLARLGDPAPAAPRDAPSQMFIDDPPENWPSYYDGPPR